MESRLTPNPQSNNLAILVLLVWLLTTMSLWGLAFYPVEAASPQWLARTQFVCFGSLPNGMPASFGWMILFAGPALLLSVFLTIYNGELLLDWKAGSSIFKKGMLLLFFLFLVESAWVLSRVKTITRVETFAPNQVETLPEYYPKQSIPSPAFSLVDQNGQTITEKTFQGKAVIFSFIFAHCQTVCPVLVHNILGAFEKIDHQKVEVLFITLDPWRDTPKSLPTLAKKWKLPDGAHILSGNPKVVSQVLENFKVIRERDMKTGDVTHAAIVHVLDSTGKISYTFNNPTIDWITSAVQRVFN